MKFSAPLSNLTSNSGNTQKTDSPPKIKVSLKKRVLENRVSKNPSTVGGGLQPARKGGERGTGARGLRAGS